MQYPITRRCSTPTFRGRVGHKKGWPPTRNPPPISSVSSVEKPSGRWKIIQYLVSGGKTFTIGKRMSKSELRRLRIQTKQQYQNFGGYKSLQDILDSELLHRIYIDKREVLRKYESVQTPQTNPRSEAGPKSD